MAQSGYLDDIEIDVYPEYEFIEVPEEDDIEYEELEDTEEIEEELFDLTPPVLWGP